MIQHICDEPIFISRSEFERYRRLFKVDFDDQDQPMMAALIKATGYVPDRTLVAFTWLFLDNKTAITLDIRCGQSNAYDDTILYTGVEFIDESIQLWEGQEEYVFDCDYDLSETIEFVYNNEKYICKFQIYEDDISNVAQLTIGQEVYCIYNESVLTYAVYAIGAYSFIVRGYRAKEDDAQEWFIGEYKEKWFTDLEEAKTYLMGGFNPEEYEMRETASGCFEVFKKF